MTYEQPSEDSVLEPQVVAFLEGLNTEMNDAYAPLEQEEQELRNASYAQAAAAEAVGIAMLRIEAEPQGSVAEAHNVLEAAAAEAGHLSNDEATLKYYGDPSFNPETSPNAFDAGQRRTAEAAVREMIEKGTLHGRTDGHE